MTSYSELIHKIFLLHTTQRGNLHLDAITRLCEAFGNPQKEFKTIHVAGSNGKGSVTNMIARGLQSSDKKVGMFTSPHLFSFRERIQINHQKISEECVIRYLTDIFSVCEKEKIDASFFEMTTLMAFLFFRDSNVDYAVIEAGIGGRYDATNVVIPVLSIITSLSLEHTDLLGHTLEEIAFEKAGIIKPFVPVILGPKVPPDIFSEVAKSNHASLCLIDKLDGFNEDYRLENAQIAKQALQLLGIHQLNTYDLLAFTPPCRYETFQSPAAFPIIFDVGHNPDGLNRLRASIQRDYSEKNVLAVIAISSTKDLEQCVKAISPIVSHWYLTEASNGRSYTTKALENELERQNIFKITCHKSSYKAMQAALAHAIHEKDPLVLVCGSFFIMGETRRACGIHDETDAIDLNERSMPKRV